MNHKTINIVAQMLIRNEADVIEEVLQEVFRYVDTCVVLDGYSDDGTQEILDRVERKVAPKKLLRWYSSPDPNGQFADHRRNELLECTAEFEPDWVWSVDGDEIAHTSIVEAVEVAEAAGTNVLICQVPQFWITLADIRNGLLIEDQSISIQKRRRWYSWGHVGRFIWRWHPGHYYPPNVQKRTPELPGLSWNQWQWPGPIQPIIKHYCFRSLQQAVKRMEERQKRGGRAYFGKYYESFILDEVEVGLHYFQGEWCTINNHGAVGEYMARQRDKNREGD